MQNDDSMKAISIRLPQHLLDKMPPASLHGDRAKFIREAIREKLERQEKKSASAV